MTRLAGAVLTGLLTVLLAVIPGVAPAWARSLAGDPSPQGSPGGSPDGGSPPVLEAPTGLKATAVSSSEIDLSWTPPREADIRGAERDDLRRALTAWLQPVDMGLNATGPDVT